MDIDKVHKQIKDKFYKKINKDLDEIIEKNKDNTLAENPYNPLGNGIKLNAIIEIVLENAAYIRRLEEKVELLGHEVDINVIDPRNR